MKHLRSGFGGLLCILATACGEEPRFDVATGTATGAIIGGSLSGPADFPSTAATEFSREGDTTHFLYAGDGNTLVRELARLDLRDLLVEEPSLEEIFLHYYRTEA